MFPYGIKLQSWKFYPYVESRRFFHDIIKWNEARFLGAVVYMSTQVRKYAGEVVNMKIQIHIALGLK